MTILFLLIGTFVILAAMLYLTLAVNDFERKTKQLSVLLERRYTIAIPQKQKTIEGPGKAKAKA